MLCLNEALKVAFQATVIAWSQKIELAPGIVTEPNTGYFHIRALAEVVLASNVASLNRMRGTQSELALLSVETAMLANMYAASVELHLVNKLCS